MNKNKWGYLHTLYLVGGILIFIFAIVALVSFCKAVTYKENEPVRSYGYADSIQVENLKKEVSVLSFKVDSLKAALQQKPKVRYRYINSKKDSSVIEIHVHND